MGAILSQGLPWVQVLRMHRDNARTNAIVRATQNFVRSRRACAAGSSTELWPPVLPLNLGQKLYEWDVDYLALSRQACQTYPNTAKHSQHHIPSVHYTLVYAASAPTDDFTVSSSPLLQECCALVACIWHATSTVDVFSIRPDHLFNFINAVSARYHDNPYHNWNHAVQVLHDSFLLLREGVGSSAQPLSQLHVISLLLAAVGHDVDHPGTNNAFMVSTDAQLALRYNDVSVLEHPTCTPQILDETSAS